MHRGKLADNQKLKCLSVCVCCFWLLPSLSCFCLVCSTNQSHEGKTNRTHTRTPIDWAWNKLNSTVITFGLPVPLQAPIEANERDVDMMRCGRLSDIMDNCPKSLKIYAEFYKMRRWNKRSKHKPQKQPGRKGAPVSPRTTYASCGELRSGPRWLWGVVWNPPSTDGGWPHLQSANTHTDKHTNM